MTSVTSSICFGLVNIPVSIKSAFHVTEVDLRLPRGEIVLSGFVQSDEVDPIYFDRTYFAEPVGEARAYAVLLRAMNECGLGALGHFGGLATRRPCHVSPRRNVLVLRTLLCREVLVDTVAVESLVAATEVRDAELDLTKHVIEAYVGAAPSLQEMMEARPSLQEMMEARLADASHPECSEDIATNIVDLAATRRRNLAAEHTRTSHARRHPKR